MSTPTRRRRRQIFAARGYTEAAGYPPLRLTDPAALRASVGTVIYFGLVALLSAGVATVVRDSAAALIAVFTLLFASASDRRAEFATARVTGMTRVQVVQMALGESVAVIGIGLLLGGLAAAGTVLGLASAIRDLIGISAVSVRWPLLGALALGAAAVVGVTSVLTTLVATRRPAIHLVGARE